LEELVFFFLDCPFISRIYIHHLARVKHTYILEEGNNLTALVYMSKDHFSVDIIGVNNEEDDNLELQQKAEFGVTPISKEDISKLFSGRNLAFISTLSKDNSPHVTPVWADMDEKEELILINSFEGSAKVRNVRRDPRVAISIVETHNTYKMLSMKGKVVEVTANGADEHLHKLAKKYLGIGKYYYRKPSHRRVILKVKPEKVMGISIHPAFYFLAYSP
jgi:PPOX class probable F420-dependent enzyme